MSSLHADDSQPSSRVILSAEDAADEYEDEEDECDLDDDDGYVSLLVLWLAVAGNALLICCFASPMVFRLRLAQRVQITGPKSSLTEKKNRQA